MVIYRVSSESGRQGAENLCTGIEKKHFFNGCQYKSWLWVNLKWSRGGWTFAQRLTGLWESHLQRLSSPTLLLLHKPPYLDSLLPVMSELLRPATSLQLTKQGTEDRWGCSHKHQHQRHLLYPAITATCSPQTAAQTVQLTVAPQLIISMHAISETRMLSMQRKQ